MERHGYDILKLIAFMKVLYELSKAIQFYYLV